MKKKEIKKSFTNWTLTISQTENGEVKMRGICFKNAEKLGADKFIKRLATIINKEINK